jgi:hypothetical protein
MTKPKRYAVAIRPNGEIVVCEQMTKCPKDTPETWEPGNLSRVPDWANVWAKDEAEARERALAMWREKR